MLLIGPGRDRVKAYHQHMRDDAVTEFVYVGDVMCSWCWGFAPTLDQLAENFTIPIRVVNGGLRPGPNAEVLDDAMAGFLRHHWDQVSAASGQPFDDDFLDRRDGWRYDTELPAIAVTTMRTQSDSETRSFFCRLQKAFYAEGVDVTDASAYSDLISDFGVDSETFLAALRSDDMKWAAWDDFEESRAMGIAGFPALILRLDGTPAIVTRGYAPYNALEAPLVEFIRTRAGTELLGQVCTIDGVC